MAPSSLPVLPVGCREPAFNSGCAVVDPPDWVAAGQTVAGQLEGREGAAPHIAFRALLFGAETNEALGEAIEDHEGIAPKPKETDVDFEFLLETATLTVTRASDH